MFRFTRFAVAGLTALSLTLTPISVSAAPDGEDYAKALAAIALIGIVGAAARDKDKRKTRSRTTYKNPYGSIEGSRSPNVIQGEIHRGGKGGIKGKPRARHALLPGHCARTLSTGHRDRTVFDSRCLKRNFAYSKELPRDCRIKVSTPRGVRTVYGARCLRRDGWRVAGY